MSRYDLANEFSSFLAAVPVATRTTSVNAHTSVAHFLRRKVSESIMGFTVLTGITAFGITSDARGPREERQIINTGKDTSASKEAIARLNAFLDARVLHFPESRCQSKVASKGQILQPTAKGLAYLQEWFNVHAASVAKDPRVSEAITEVLLSPYNSMNLVKLERSLLRNALIQNTGLAMTLWTRLLGDAPNFAEASDSADYAYRKRPADVLNPGIESIKSSLSLGDSSSSGSESRRVKSPYALRVARHPNSRSHMQHWDNRGAKLFQNLRFEAPRKSRFSSTREYTVDYVFSGRALFQWVMECTTAETSEEGRELLKALLSNHFLRQIRDPVIDAVTCNEDDCAGATSSAALYRFTPRGLRLCAWADLVDERNLDEADFLEDYAASVEHLNAEKNETASAEGRSWAWEHSADNTLVSAAFTDMLTMELMHHEPALKMLFREKLHDWHAEENLAFIDEAQRLGLLMRAARGADRTVSRKSRLRKDTWMMARAISERFIEPGAPQQINISQTLRQAILRDAAAEDSATFEKDLAAAQEHCSSLLQALLTRFATNDGYLASPLRAYIVTRHVRKQRQSQLPQQIDTLLPGKLQLYDCQCDAH